MIRRPPRSTLLTHSFPTRRSSDLGTASIGSKRKRDVPRCHDDSGAGTRAARNVRDVGNAPARAVRRSEEHTSELQSLMRISYAVFCLKKTKINNILRTIHRRHSTTNELIVQTTLAYRTQRS